ncbi:MAG: transcriptional repressor LexA [Bdellovibrio sp. CG10_big_fil_rev_8_21_14_0_10_47_8]|nr:MAG: transcriptional repressor LexA [Bdellovibrio sp. CG10_big_fil_rev_8_21_14_0_10_47_8]
MCMKQPLPLTEKEKAVLEFIESQIVENGFAPSYQEIKDHFGFASFNSVQNYLKQLTSKGYVQIANNQKRSIQVLHSSQAVQQLVQSKVISKTGSPRSLLLPTPGEREEVLNLPLLGRVAAGVPLEAFDHDEFVQVPPNLVRNPTKSYALKVKGSSMIEDGIFDGDIILVQKQASASNGEIIVASIENESTVKRFFLQPDPEAKASGKLIELRPANSSMKSMWYPPDQVDIQGVVVGLIRKF